MFILPNIYFAELYSICQIYEPGNYVVFEKDDITFKGLRQIKNLLNSVSAMHS